MATGWDELTGEQAGPQGSSASPTRRATASPGAPSDPPSTPGRTGSYLTPPPGYRLWYHLDFRTVSQLPPGWTVRLGRTNNAATFRAENVRLDRRRGLVHTAERTGPGAPVYSGAVNGWINVPQRFCIRYTAQAEGFRRGVWPSFWMRPQSDGEGEIDLVEGFGGHIGSPVGPRVWGAGLVATPYGPGQVTRGVDFGLPPSQWNQPHEYLQCMTGTELRSFVDGVERPRIVRAGEPPGPGGQSMPAGVWDAQFAGDTTWYLRTDLQIGDDPDGDPVGQAGPLSSDQVGRFASWAIQRVAIFTPTG